MSKIELKIHIYTLAQQARITRKYERRLKRMKDHMAHPDYNAPIKMLDGSIRSRPKYHVPGTNPEGYKAWGNAELLRLQHLRVHEVRPMTRVYHLAHMFLKGTPYKAAEPIVHNHLLPWHIDSIEEIALRFARFDDKAPTTKEARRSGVWKNEQQFRQAFAEWINVDL